MRHRVLLIASLSLVLVAMLVVMAVDRPFDRSPVYAVAAQRTQATRQPTAWRGRIVPVRAVAVACVPTAGVAPDEPWCLPPSLIDPGPPDPSVWLPLTLGAPNPPLAVLRRVPLLASLAPFRTSSGGVRLENRFRYITAVPRADRRPHR